MDNIVEEIESIAGEIQEYYDRGSYDYIDEGLEPSDVRDEVDELKETS